MFPSDADRSERLVRRAEERVRLLLALERTQLLPEGMTVQPIGAPEMTPQLALAIFKYLARTPSQVMVVQPEDVFGQLDQINLPGTTDQYPNWRRKLTLEPRAMARRSAPAGGRRRLAARERGQYAGTARGSGSGGEGAHDADHSARDLSHAVQSRLHVPRCAGAQCRICSAWASVISTHRRT